MNVKEVTAKVVLDSKGEKTIEVSAMTEFGIFSASAPSGISKGKNETPAFVRNVEESIKKVTDLSEKISQISIEEFSHLDEIEKLTDRKILGANALYALETALLKALAAERGEELWRVINPNANIFPLPLGNCIGGGMHTQGKRPDFQEFLIMPKAKKFSDNVFMMKEAHRLCGERLKLLKSKGKVGMEGEWSTELENEKVLEILDKTRQEIIEMTDNKVEIGIDVAASSFYGDQYLYQNPLKVLDSKEQKEYIKKLIEDYRIGYVEDAFSEEDFVTFSKLREEVSMQRPCLIVGDDLIASQLDRLKKALINKSVNAIIVKPNQNGSLLEIKKLVDLAKKYNIATVMSHRAGETLDYALADYAFAFQTEVIKTGIIGKEREVKLNRLVEIERKIDDK